MSVSVDDKNIFTKEMTSVFQTEVIECPDCTFEFASKHELDGAEGCYECPACREADLEIENQKLNEQNKRLIAETEKDNVLIDDFQKEIKRLEGMLKDLSDYYSPEN